MVKVDTSLNSAKLVFPSVAWFKVCWHAFGDTYCAATLIYCGCIAVIILTLWGWGTLNAYLMQVGLLSSFGVRNQSNAGLIAALWIIIQLTVAITSGFVVFGTVTAVIRIRRALRKQEQQPVSEQASDAAV